MIPAAPPTRANLRVGGPQRQGRRLPGLLKPEAVH